MPICKIAATSRVVPLYCGGPATQPPDRLRHKQARCAWHGLYKDGQSHVASPIRSKNVVVAFRARTDDCVGFVQFAGRLAWSDSRAKFGQ